MRRVALLFVAALVGTAGLDGEARAQGLSGTTVRPGGNGYSGNGGPAGGNGQYVNGQGSDRGIGFGGYSGTPWDAFEDPNEGCVKKRVRVRTKNGWRRRLKWVCH